MNENSSRRRSSRDRRVESAEEKGLRLVVVYLVLTFLSVRRSRLLRAAIRQSSNNGGLFSFGDGARRGESSRVVVPNYSAPLVLCKQEA